MDTRRRPRDREQLHQTVRQLVEEGKIGEPDEWPEYVWAPKRPGEGVGWYWTPAGGQRTVLGANVFLALLQLDRERER